MFLKSFPNKLFNINLFYILLLRACPLCTNYNFTLVLGVREMGFVKKSIVF